MKKRVSKSEQVTLRTFLSQHGLKIEGRKVGTIGYYTEILDSLGMKVRLIGKGQDLSCQTDSETSCLEVLAQRIRGRQIMFHIKTKGENEPSGMVVPVPEGLIPFIPEAKPKIKVSAKVKAKLVPTLNKVLKDLGVVEEIRKFSDGSFLITLIDLATNQPVAIGMKRKAVCAWGPNKATARATIVSALNRNKGVYLGDEWVEVPANIKQYAKPVDLNYNKFLQVYALKEQRNDMAPGVTLALIDNRDTVGGNPIFHKDRHCQWTVRNGTYRDTLILMVHKLRGQLIEYHDSVSPGKETKVSTIRVPMNLVIGDVPHQCEDEDESSAKEDLSGSLVGRLCEYHFTRGEPVFGIRLASGMFLVLKDKEGSCFRIEHKDPDVLIKVFTSEETEGYLRSRGELYQKYTETIRKIREEARFNHPLKTVNVIGTGETLEVAQDRIKGLPNTVIVAVCECDGQTYIKPTTTTDKNLKEFWILSLGGDRDTNR